MLRLLTIIATTVGLLWQGPVYAETIPIDLSSAIELAAERNENYPSALQESDRASARIRAARSDAFPSLTFDGSYTRTFNIPEVVLGDQRFKIGVENSTLWGFRLEQSLFKGGKVLAAWSAAKIFANMTGEQIESARLDLELEVAIVFFDAIYARRLVETARKKVEQSEANAAVVQSKFDQGQVSEFDRLRAEVELANARPPLLEAENAVRLADTRLKHTLGLRNEDSVVLRPSTVAEPTALQTTLAENFVQAQRGRPSLRAAFLETRLYRKGVTVARSGWLYPDVSFATTYQWQMFREEFGYDPDDITTNWDARLMLSVPLFDGLRASGQISEAKVDLRQSELRLRSLKKLVALEVELARSRHIESAERLATAAGTVDLAREGLQIANVRYRNGIGAQLEVYDAQLALTVAEVNKAKAERDLNIARAAFLRALGEHLE